MFHWNLACFVISVLEHPLKMENLSSTLFEHFDIIPACPGLSLCVLPYTVGFKNYPDNSPDANAQQRHQLKVF